MTTLLLRIAAPIQSWGTSSKFNTRLTDKFPSKSGIIGMIAAAMGRTRDADIADLNQLHFGVRVDWQGTLLKDFQMMHKHQFWQTPDKNKLSLSHRYYLCDAIFLVALEGELEQLKEIESALRAPIFPLYFGRRSCPPEGKVCLGIRHDQSLLDALQKEPWLAADWMRKKAKKRLNLRIIVDAKNAEKYAFIQNDLPLSFDPKHRQFHPRYVREYESDPVTNPLGRQQHDPFDALETLDDPTEEV